MTFSNTSQNVEVIRQLSPSELSEIRSLIFSVWSFEASQGHDVQMKTRDPSLVLESLNSRSIHVLVRRDHKLVGYGRLTIFETLDELLIHISELRGSLIKSSLAKGPKGYLSRLVVDLAFQGQGVASLISQARFEIAAASGVSHLVGSIVGAQRQAKVAKDGFVPIVPIFGFQTPWYVTSRPVQLMVLDVSEWQRKSQNQRSSLFQQPISELA